VDRSDVVAKVDEANLRLVRFLWCGNDGTVRAKASSRQGLDARMQSGIGLTVAMNAMNGLDQLQPVAGMGPVGEIRLVPDPETFRVLPYAPRTGAMLVDQRSVSGEPAPVDQRAFLRRMTDRLAERGWHLEVAFENEFALAVLVDGSYVAIDSSLCFSTIGMTAAQDYTDALVGALDAQGIALEQYYAELGHGQQEISTAHRPALRAADEQLLVRETIRGVAAGHGLVASLAPKPWPDGAGNGCHIHCSLWDGERNRFFDASASDRLSIEGRAFLAGLLEHLPGLCGLTAPSFNSYRRIVPQYWAGAFTCWGHDNREAPLRLPSVFQGMEEASTTSSSRPPTRAATPTSQWAG
jgi:glutamine synthetase